MTEIFGVSYSAVMSILTLSVLVFVHELGHFLVAKMCRVCVLDFSVGFGKVLFKKRIGETTYNLRLIPLGGYVKMLGDDPFEQANLAEQSKASTTKAPKEEAGSDVSSGESSADKSSDSAGGAALGERLFAGTEAVPADLKVDPSRHFLNQTLPEKVAVVLAGPAFNLIFAVLIAIAAAWSFGIPSPVSDPIIGHVTPKLPAALAGIQAGDRVLSVNGTEVVSWINLAETVRGSAGAPLTIVVDRAVESAAIEGSSSGTNEGASERQQIEILVTGTSDNTELNVLDGTYDKDPNARPYRIGIAQATVSEPVSFFEAVPLGFRHVWAIIELTGKMFGAMFAGVISPTQTIGGPVAVFAGAAQSAAQGFESVLSFLVLLSVSLAIFNLLPVPVLDGGHLAFFLIEAIRGKPLSVRWLALANQVGLTLLLCLMLFAISNDLMRLLL